MGAYLELYGVGVRFICGRLLRIVWRGHGGLVLWALTWDRLAWARWACSVGAYLGSSGVGAVGLFCGRLFHSPPRFSLLYCASMTCISLSSWLERGFSTSSAPAMCFRITFVRYLQAEHHTGSSGTCTTGSACKQTSHRIVSHLQALHFTSK